MIDLPSMARSLAGRTADEDAVAELVATLTEVAARMQHVQDEATYLKVAARHALARFERRRKQMARREPLSMPIEDLKKAAEHKEPPLPKAETQDESQRMVEVRDQVDAVLAKLTPLERYVAREVLMEERTQETVARELGMSRPRVSQILGNGKARVLRREAP